MQKSNESISFDLDKITPRFSRILAVIRYFQAASLAMVMVYLTFIGVLFIVLSPEIRGGVLQFFWGSIVSSPSSTQGYIHKITPMMPFVLPLFFALSAGALANLERLGSLLIIFSIFSVLALFGWVLLDMAEVLGQMPSAFYYIHWVAAPLSLLMLVLVFIGVVDVITLEPKLRPRLRDGFSVNRWRTTLFRLFGIPSFVAHLGARAWVVLPLFALSSLMLATSLYPVIFPAVMVSNLVKINRSECMALDSGRLQCFEAAMLTDAILFPFYVAVAFLIPFGLYILLRRLARSTAITGMSQLMNSDNRPPVLFLRSFGDDQVFFPKKKIVSPYQFLRIGDRAEYFEHQILEEMSELGPVVAIGDPGDTSAPYGAARDYVPDAAWKDRVNLLLDESQAVVIALNDTLGIWWEVEQVLSRQHLEKSLFVFPLQDRSRIKSILNDFCEALTFHGVTPPNIVGIDNSILGFFREGESWIAVTTTNLNEIDTLAMIRLFGTRTKTNSKPKPSIFNNSFSWSLLGLLVLSFSLSPILKTLSNLAPKPHYEVVNQSSNTHTYDGEDVIGLQSENQLHKDYWLREAAFDSISNQLLMFSSVSEASPQLIWLDETGVTNTFKFSVPERDRILTGRYPSVNPVTIEQEHNGNLRIAFTTMRNPPVTLEIRQLNPQGLELKGLKLGPEHELASVQDVSLLQDGSYVVAGQIGYVDGSRGPFVGKLSEEGEWLWKHRNFGGRGWANSIAQTKSGIIGVALEVHKEWQVIGIQPDGDIIFTAPIPIESSSSGAKLIVQNPNGGWTVAGRADKDSDINTPTEPVVAALNESGTYDWVTPLIDSKGYYLQALSRDEEHIYVSGDGSKDRNDWARILVLGNNGKITGRIDFAGLDGERSISDFVLTPDGDLWTFGRASSFERDAAPIERMGARSFPWVHRFKKPSSQK